MYLKTFWDGFKEFCPSHKKCFRNAPLGIWALSSNIPFWSGFDGSPGWRHEVGLVLMVSSCPAILLKWWLVCEKARTLRGSEPFLVSSDCWMTSWHTSDSHTWNRTDIFDVSESSFNVIPEKFNTNFELKVKWASFLGENRVSILLWTCFVVLSLMSLLLVITWNKIL